MLHFFSIVLGSIALIGTVFAPGVQSADVAAQEENQIYYYDTVYATGDEPMPIDMVSTSIPYITKTQTASHLLAISCPNYTYAPAAGGCASTGGGNVIGYYDRFDENLIPDHVSGTPIANTYIYNSQDAAVKAVIDKLYEYMTGDGYGATEVDFANGITRYCNEKGKHINFYSCLSKGKFSYSVTKSYLDRNMPVVLFLSGYSVAELLGYENRDVISYDVSTGNHIMVSFGYKEYTYTTSNGTVNYNFLSVSSGLYYNSSALYDFNFQTTVNDALAIEIY